MAGKGGSPLQTGQSGFPPTESGAHVNGTHRVRNGTLADYHDHLGCLRDGGDFNRGAGEAAGQNSSLADREPRGLRFCGDRCRIFQPRG